MAHKQARRRKQPSKRRVSVPRIPVRRIVTPIFAIGAVLLTYQLSLNLLDRRISSITIEGPFERVSALQIEEAISNDLLDGFLTAKLSSVQKRINNLAWIDRANIVRRWPNELHISVTEQVPAARWGESGLLNTRGELFVDAARHIPAELPRLSGPPELATMVAKRYLEMREQLIPLGLDVRRLNLDARGAWDMTLQNGVEIRLGRRDVEQRTELFLEVVADIVSAQESDIEYADMRYSNGFAIGWKEDRIAQAAKLSVNRDNVLVGRTEQ